MAPGVLQESGLLMYLFVRSVRIRFFLCKISLFNGLSQAFKGLLKVFKAFKSLEEPLKKPYKGLSKAFGKPFEGL